MQHLGLQVVELKDSSPEKEAEAITKFRYLDWRDRVSSSRSLGFRYQTRTVICQFPLLTVLCLLEWRP